MKLIYYSVAVTFFCMASFAAPTARVERQADNTCTCSQPIVYEDELRTGLRILRDTMCPSNFNKTEKKARKTIPMVAALCKVLIASRNIKNKYLHQQQKERIHNQTCDVFQRLNVSTISDCTDSELIELQCSRAIACSHMIGTESVDYYLSNSNEYPECWLNRHLCPIPTNVKEYIRGRSTILHA